MACEKAGEIFNLSTLPISYRFLIFKKHVRFNFRIKR